MLREFWLSWTETSFPDTENKTIKESVIIGGRHVLSLFEKYNYTVQICKKYINSSVVLVRILSFMYTVEPLLWGHPFCKRKVAFQEGWPLIRGRNQYIYV